MTTTFHPFDVRAAPSGDAWVGYGAGTGMATAGRYGLPTGARPSPAVGPMGRGLGSAIGQPTPSNPIDGISVRAA